MGKLRFLLSSLVEISSGVGLRSLAHGYTRLLSTEYANISYQKSEISIVDRDDRYQNLPITDASYYARFYLLVMVVVVLGLVMVNLRCTFRKWHVDYTSTAHEINLTFKN